MLSPRVGVLVGAVIAVSAALVLFVAPVGWFEDLLDVSGDEATRFLLRRYAASATAALFVVVVSAARNVGVLRTALLGLATWFGAQGAVAVWGLVAGTVGGLAWAALFADPLIAVWFLVLSAQVKGSPRRPLAD